MISPNLWKILYLFANDSTLCHDIPHPLDRKVACSLFSLQTLTKSKDGQTLGICLSILTNLTLSLSLSLQKDHLAKLPSTFLTILLRKFSHSNSWVSLSAMIFLGQTAFQSWPPKLVTDWASSIMWSPSLAHLNSYSPAMLSSTGWWKHWSQL